MSDETNVYGAGTAAYSPAMTVPDGTLIYRTRSSHKVPASGPAMTAGVIGNLMPPDPSEGGEYGQVAQLGWTDGLGKAVSNRTSFTGRTLVRPTMGVNPPTGPVGYSTRTARLRQRIEALYTDYTPSNQAVAQEVLSNG